MKIILIILATVVIIAFVVKVLTNASDIEREHERKLAEDELSRQKLKEAMEAYERAKKNHNPAQSLANVAQTAHDIAAKAQAEAERKRKEAAALKSRRTGLCGMTIRATYRKCSNSTRSPKTGACNYSKTTC